MSLIGDMFGAGKGFEFISNVIDKIWPDKGEAEAAKLRLAEMAHSGELARLAAETDLLKGQIDINKAEAASSSVFIAGWRPFIGWVCGWGLFWQFILQPSATWALAVAGVAYTPLPDYHFAELLPLVFTLLGVGWMRSYEKARGVSS